MSKHKVNRKDRKPAFDLDVIKKSAVRLPVKNNTVILDRKNPLHRRFFED